MALEYLNIGRIGRCVIEGAGKKSFPAKEMIQDAQRRESMTSYGEKPEFQFDWSKGYSKHEGIRSD